MAFGKPHQIGALELYEPLDVLKPVGPDIWIVDGPEIEFGFAGIKMPFPTRMTVIRLSSGDLLVHSPIFASSEVEASMAALGPVRHIIAPNTLHYWWAPEWQARYPDATLYGVPGLEKRAKRVVQVDVVLGDKPLPFLDDLGVVVVGGGFFTEAVFFHRASRTLILTDLIENFEPGRVRNWFYRVMLRLGGAADPDGKAPLDMRWSFLGRRTQLRVAVKQMIEWAPEAVIVAHGRWYRQNGVTELRRAFRWVL